MGRLNKNRKILAVIVITLVLAAPAPASFAQSGVPAITAGIVSYIADLSLEDFILGLLTAPLRAIGALIGWAAAGFAKFADPAVQDYFLDFEPVRQSWDILKNFVNLFFILILIIMSFGTIFDIQKYNWRSLLGPFLIAALFINFSFAIAQYVIGIANGLAAILLRTIGGQDIGYALANGLGLQRIFDLNPAAGGSINPTVIGGRLFVATVFGIIFAAIAMFAFLSAFLFTLARIPILWFLLIISPLAVLAAVLPNTKPQWQRWRKAFVSWSFFLPVYLFFLMFAFIFINSRNEPASPLAGGPPSILAALLTFQDLFFYAVTLVFLIGGLAMAKKVGDSMGEGVGFISGKIDAGIKRIPIFGKYGGVSAVESGVKQTIGRVKEEGFRGRLGLLYGGERAERLRAAGVAEALGAKGERAKVRMGETNKEQEKLRQAIQTMSPVQVRAFLAKEGGKSGIRGDAAMLEHAKQGYSGFEDYQSAMARFGGEYTLFGREYLKNIKEAKFSKLFESSDQELMLAKREATPGRFQELARALAQDLAEKNRITNKEDFAELKRLLEPVPRELRNFMNAIKPEIVYGTRDLRQEALRDGHTDPDLALKLINFMKEQKEINSTDLLYRVLERLGGEELGSSRVEAGKTTTEGRSVINEINKFYPSITVEMDVRTERGIRWDEALPPDAETQIVNKLADILANKEDADIRKMSAEFFKDRRFKEAAQRAFTDDITRVSELLKGAPTAMRRALKDLALP